MTFGSPQPGEQTDAMLIAAFVDAGSEPAFGVLVQRHLPMVHAAARRQVRDRQMADDVAQAVFILLARKARSISKPELLPAWLLKVTRFASLDARKMEARRRSHERKAAEMNEATRAGAAAEGEELSALLPLLDGALSRLRETDRAAVAMRFLEGRSMSAVGAAAGISEAAAAKRVGRALEKLRGIFKGRGTVLSVAGVAATLSAVGEASAGVIPRTSAATISGTALSAAQGIVPGAAASMSIAKGAGHIMAIAQAKSVAVVLSAVAFTVAGGGMVAHYARAQHAAAAPIGAVAAPAGNPTPALRAVVPAAAPAVVAEPIPPAPEKKPAPLPPAVKPATLDRGSVPVQMSKGIGGTVKLEGEAPVMPKIDMSGIAQCAQHHAGPVSQETVVVGKEGGLANVVVSIKKQEGMDLPGEALKEPAVLDQKGCQYVPHVVAVMVGQPIVVKNSDGFLHNVHTLSEKNEGQNLAQPTVGEAKLRSPREAEYYRVKCDVHPWMNAWIAVIDNPYFAVTDQEGKFVLPKGLPDGEYVLRAWHEKYGEQEARIGVKDGRAMAEFIFRVR